VVERRRLRAGPATRVWTLRAGSLAVVFGLWWLLTALEIWSPLILPSPSAVWHAFQQSVTSDGRRRGLAGSYLWEHLGASMWRVANGLFWAALIGPVVGLVLAMSRSARTVFEPWVSFLRSLPPLGYFTILIFWFGIKDTSKIWLLFLAAFPPITLATINGVERVRADRVDAARSLGGSRMQVVRHVVLPSALPDIITGLRVATGFAWTTIVAAETVNGLPGIGGLAWFTKKDTRIDVAVMCVIVIGVTAIVLDQLLQLVERALVPWKGRA
jgi:taurine transport system permease protein